jgi:hypothetical protein
LSHITEEQVLGWFVRGLHYWSAGMLMLVFLFHLCSGNSCWAGYKAPREATWLIGVLLFFCILFMSYSGYLLRWDERGVHGTQVMLHMISRVPLVGERLVLFVQGGRNMGAQTLTRIYAHARDPCAAVDVSALAVITSTWWSCGERSPKETPQQPVRRPTSRRRSTRRNRTRARGRVVLPEATMLKSGTFTSVVFTSPWS